MSGDVQLLALERDDGAPRLVVRFIAFDSGSHGLEIGIERRALEGFQLQKRVALPLSEVFVFHDAIGRACELAKVVRR